MISSFYLKIKFINKLEIQITWNMFSSNISTLYYAPMVGDFPLLLMWMSSL